MTTSIDDRNRSPGPIKQYLPKTLFGRSLLIIITPLILMQVLSAYIFYERHWDTMTRRLVLSLAGDIGLVVSDLGPTPSAEMVEAMNERVGSLLDMALSFHDGEILPNKPPSTFVNEVEHAMQEAMASKVRRPFVMNSDTIPRRIQILVQLRTGVLEIITHHKRLYSSTTYIFILWMVGSSLLLFAVAIVFMRNQIRPIIRLADAARAFGLGRDAPAFKSGGAAEVRQAAAAFQQMRNRIQRQVQQRTDMLAGVSHDLRTPLTRMKLQLAMLGDGQDVAELRADVAEMERMVEGYLAFARGEGTEEPVTGDLGKLVREVVSSETRDGREIELRGDETDKAVFPIRLDAFRRAIGNLLANAKRHAETVRVTMAFSGDQVTIAIEDDGPGIPEENRRDAFRPFFRLESSRNPGTGGVGLGLTIARDITRNHGGDLTLDQSEDLGGLKAVMTFPL